MKKSLKFTQIYFNEGEPLMEISTHSTNLKRRLTQYAKDYPTLCQITEDEEGCMSFLIDKRRCSLRLTAPYSDERRQKASALAKEQGVHTRKGGPTDG